MLTELLKHFPGYSEKLTVTNGSIPIDHATTYTEIKSTVKFGREFTNKGVTFSVGTNVSTATIWLYCKYPPAKSGTPAIETYSVVGNYRPATLAGIKRKIKELLKGTAH